MPTQPLAAIFCGDREWSDRQAIFDTALRHYPLTEDKQHLHPRNVLIEGDATGADRIAGQVADILGIKCDAFPADWDKHHRAAGPIRNRQMLDYLLTFSDTHRLLVIAFHDDLLNSKGTLNMVRQAAKRNAHGKKISVLNIRHKT